MELEVVIKCQGASEVTLDQLQLLHHFKTLTDEDYTRGKNVLIERGFKFPFSVWLDGENNIFTVDGHQRIAILKRMREEGVKLPEKFPVNYVFAENKADAAKDIIASETKLASINESDFTEFLTEYDINWEDVEDWANVPLEDDKQAYGDNQKDEKEIKGVICPNCQFHFKPEKANYE